MYASPFQSFGDISRVLKVCMAHLPRHLERRGEPRNLGAHGQPTGIL
jgi:hypothetical protein